ncbi:hypothetical protein AB6A40_006672 [Gnathostoma spinigerum]|uniref:Glutaminyl-peptide cyclotransferase n=1 Tax=Gnathostoma spinigerum TaxID=75299 RepID=A0ABD6ESF8_9BILA
MRTVLIVFSVIVTMSCYFPDFVHRKQRWKDERSLSKSSMDKLCRMTNRQKILELLKPLLVERVVGTPNHETVRNYIVSKLHDKGFVVELDNFDAETPLGTKSFSNIIATYNPEAPRRLVLACHYDSKYFKKQVFIGATDSAVPCAILLDLAETLAPYLPRQNNHDVSLQLIFFDGEEAFVRWSRTDSIYGARHLAHKWQNNSYSHPKTVLFDVQTQLDRIDVLVLLDLLGERNPRINNMYGYGTSNLFKNFEDIENDLRSLNCTNKLPKIFFSEQSLEAAEDDHIPFLLRNVPVLHLISVPFPTVWHKISDNAAALHYPTIENLASIIRVFVAEYLAIKP